ncbi:hypothetical protein WJX75_009126 [Coccomyxa subellipsoidea]|uniref:Uncharacterized protein n=1 Tax=Coccomyxa subellipsoidea TaxID=248742 RepID=A0ABR2YEC4_9CHLO
MAEASTSKQVSQEEETSPVSTSSSTPSSQAASTGQQIPLTQLPEKSAQAVSSWTVYGGAYDNGTRCTAAEKGANMRILWP